ncbi:MAG: hypothetical protein ACKO37_03195 [Vampirovibrionales bacterium]
MQVQQRKRLLTLFLLTVCLTLIVMIVVFSLVFQNVMFNFNTRIPDTAPNPLESLPTQGQHAGLEGGSITPRVNAPSDGIAGSTPTGNSNKASEPSSSISPESLSPEVAPSPNTAPLPSEGTPSETSTTTSGEKPSSPSNKTPTGGSDAKVFKTDRSTLQIQPPEQKAGVGQLPTTPHAKAVPPSETAPPLPAPPLPKP